MAGTMTRTILLTIVMSAAFAVPAWGDAVTVSKTDAGAAIENDRVKVEYDLGRGTFAATDKATGALCLRDAFTRVGEWASNNDGRKAQWESKPAAPAMGEGKTLVLRSAKAGQPTLLLEISLYAGRGFVVLAAGVDNATDQAIQVKEICPLTGGEAFPLEGPRTQERTLSGPGGSGDTRVTPGVNRGSVNDLLLTFVAGGKRRSLAMGGLTYREFNKYASLGGSTEQVRRNDLQARVGPSGRLAAYVDCGVKAADADKAGLSLRLTQGEPYNWGEAGGAVDPAFASIVFSYQQIAFEAAGLDPQKPYLLGWSWWDFDDNARVESVVAVGSDGKRYTLLDKKLLPAHKDKNQPPQEWALPIPQAAYASGKMQIVFANDGGRTNAVVSEVWLWEGKGGGDGQGQGELAVPAGLATGRNIARIAAPNDSGGKIVAELKAADPIGKRVDAGKGYLGEEKFYLDFTTADPFAAMEQYGLAVRAAQNARPIIYDFPTTCGWYVGLFEWGQANNYPERSKYLAATTAGLVEEVQKAADGGFLNYSRMAVRIVPDKYEGMEPKGPTQQGWWDDEHWARYHHYTPPYETTKKYCDGVRQRGGLPFTYFQLVFEDREFRLTHRDLLLGKDPNRTLDYSNPATQEYMRKVYANLRAGGMAGMMFDYPDGCWGNLTRGGFEDKYATAAGVYRTIFALAKEGLGPVSWIHERVLGDPNSDLTAGVVDSQRVWGDNSQITPEMVSRCGLRWYKNRVLFSYDMDAKNLLHGWKRPGFACSDQDGRRMLVTMAYVAASRMLLSTSYRDMPKETLWDFERTFPYHDAPKSARPVDMLVCKGWPKVYDFAVSPQWHQVTFFNNDDPAKETELGVDLAGEPAAGSLGLDAAKDYYAYDFWNDRLAGKFKGSERLTQTLRPGEARMLSVHQVEPNPQFLSTNRHIMQGYIDLAVVPKWDAQKKALAGASKVVGGETYKVVIATNGFKAAGATAAVAATGGATAGSAAAGSASAKVEMLPGEGGLAVLSIDAPQNATVEWTVTFQQP